MTRVAIYEESGSLPIVYVDVEGGPSGFGCLVFVILALVSVIARLTL